MSKRYEIPPLDLLKGFEAAARHLSFTKAAEELFLTQSAVSRQIKALEEHLTVPLFRRQRRGLALTEQGQMLQRTVTDVLARLHETTRTLRGDSDAHILTITTAPGIASLWLIPRLAGYTRTRPEVDVRISATNEVLDLESYRIHLAIRYAPALSGVGTRLFSETVFPVCSPALLQDASRQLREPRDLAQQVLIHFEDPRSGDPSLDWMPWLTAMGLADLKPAGALRFDQYDRVIAAALAGQGVALGRDPLVRQLVREGRLVAPFEAASCSPRAYFLVEAAHAAGNAEVAAFREWLLAEAKAERRASR